MKLRKRRNKSIKAPPILQKIVVKKPKRTCEQKYRNWGELLRKNCHHMMNSVVNYVNSTTLLRLTRYLWSTLGSSMQQFMETCCYTDTSLSVLTFNGSDTGTESYVTDEDILWGSSLDTRQEQANQINQLCKQHPNARTAASQLWNWKVLQRLKRTPRFVSRYARLSISATINKMTDRELFLFYKIVKNASPELVSGVTEPIRDFYSLRKLFRNTVKNSPPSIDLFSRMIHTWYLITPIIYEICSYAGEYVNHLDLIVSDVDRLYRVLLEVRSQHGVSTNKLKGSVSMGNVT